MTDDHIHKHRVCSIFSYDAYISAHASCKVAARVISDPVKDPEIDRARWDSKQMSPNQARRCQGMNAPLGGFVCVSSRHV
jgi:hypothetical protein